MSGKILSSSGTENMEKTKTGDAANTSETTTKMALVKPMQKKDTKTDKTPTGANDQPPEATAGISLARPKLGRTPQSPPAAAQVTEESATPEPVLSSPETVSDTKLKPMANQLSGGWLDGYTPEAPKTSGSSWDLRFTLILVGLLVVVNVALVTLLHNNHKAEPVITRIQSPETVATAHQPVTELAPVAHAVNGSVTVSRAAPVAAAAMAPAPAHAEPLKDIPNPATLSPAAGQRSPTTQPAETMAPASLPPVQAATPQSRQELLNILNKE